MVIIPALAVEYPLVLRRWPPAAGPEVTLSARWATMRCVGTEVTTTGVDPPPTAGADEADLGLDTSDQRAALGHQPLVCPFAPLAGAVGTGYTPIAAVAAARIRVAREGGAAAGAAPPGTTARHVSIIPRGTFAPPDDSVPSESGTSG